MDGDVGVAICARWCFGKCPMKRLIFIFLLCLVLPSVPVSAQGHRKHLYLCRSPLLAFNFWEALQNIQQQGVTLTPTIAQQICEGMKAGQDPQCIRVAVDEFKPVASGWGGALALTDGKTKVWFHNPDAGGWVHPDYYVSLVNSK
jgi:hypothetical protein